MIYFIKLTYASKQPKYRFSLHVNVAHITHIVPVFGSDGSPREDMGNSYVYLSGGESGGDQNSLFVQETQDEIISLLNSTWGLIT